MSYFFSPEFLHSNLFNWLILPSLIFLSRTCDVTLATLRNIFLSRGIRKIVPLIGFIEVLIWLVAISSIIKNLHNVLCYIAFAGGYSMGIFVGIKIEEKLALGLQIIRIITNQDCSELIHALNTANLGSTTLDAQGAKGPVKVMLTIVKRKDSNNVLQLIQQYTPQAFVTIEDIRKADQGVFPRTAGESTLDYFKRIFPTLAKK